jgi:acyloxyacyl hydrolase
MLSASTAFYENTSSFPNINGPVNSSYLVNRRRNRCTHRDYQNLGVNGARAGSMNETIQEGLSRSDLDHPALVLYALIGNDVCNGYVC